MQVPLFRLQCGVNSYDWGKLGQDSEAARLAAATAPSDFSIQQNKPYSELWMGTHPSLPSRDVVTHRTLLDLVQNNQALMSPEISSKYGNKLPFLFKVLSIRKALSIQAHPDKKLAEQLHARDPKNYPDDNHKPEMAIALTAFDGLCGFRPLAEIAHFLNSVPPLRKLVGESAASGLTSAINKEGSDSAHAEMENKAALKSAFSALMRAEPSAVKAAAETLVASARQEGSSFAGGGGPTNSGDELAQLIIRLNDQFPGDIGLFVVFFVNYVKLDVGEAMFLQADDIHAYLSGDIIECMASSDNVVRAGFTPKFKDIETLTTMLTYSYAPISEQKMEPKDYPYVTLNTTAYTSGSAALLYDPPIEEFAVIRASLKKSGAKATFEAISGPSIYICTQGQGTISVGPKNESVSQGSIFFGGATAETILEATSDDEFVTYRAFCELSDDRPHQNGS